MVSLVTTVDDADSRTFDEVLVLYIACAKFPDGEVDEAEGKRILELTHRHTQGLAEHYAEQALADVAKAFAEAGGPAEQLTMLVESAEHLAEALDEAAKVQLVEELRTIAKANGVDTEAEHDFVDAAAKTLGVG